MSEPLRDLGAVLREWLKHPGSSHLAMENAIRRCAAAAKDQGQALSVDRRKLKAILAGTDVALTFGQMQALDAFLAQECRRSFASLFERQDLVSALVDYPEVRVLLGAHPREERGSPRRQTDLSSWDIRAMQEVFLRLSKASGRVKLSFRDVVPSRRADDPERPGARELDQVDRHTAVVSIGSQRASAATEVMLARMFGVEPFTQRASTNRRLPFHFVWDEATDTRSAVGAFSKRLRDVPMKARPAGTKAKAPPWALEIEGQYFWLERFVDTSKTYGLVVAQRHKNAAGQENLWVVLAGLSGPGTAAAAKFIDHQTLRLPLIDNTPAPVVWLAVEADVVLTDEPGDNRRVIGWHVIHGPVLWRSLDAA